MRAIPAQGNCGSENLDFIENIICVCRLDGSIRLGIWLAMCMPACGIFAAKCGCHLMEQWDWYAIVRTGSNN